MSPDTSMVAVVVPDATSVEVSFTLLGSSPVVAPATLWLACEDLQFQDAVTWDGGEASKRVQLQPGTYSAAIETKTGFGAVAVFAVEVSPVSVALAAFRSFDLRLGVIDTSNSKPVPDAVAICKRVDLAKSWPVAIPVRATTGPDGQVMLEGLGCGEWEIRVEKTGFETGQFETPLPGPWEPHIEAYGFIDMQQYGITALRTLTLQLVGADAWDDLSLFSGNHSSEAPPLSFDANGRLVLQLGYVEAPLFLYIVYPDGQQSAMNLLGQLPPEGDPVEISIGGEGTLEVALHVAQAVRDAVGESDCYLRVFFKTATGDTRRIRQKALTDGTFEFHGIQGHHATVCFHVEAESGRADWSIQEVELKGGRVERTTLSVDSLPPALQFTDEAGSPLAGLWTELYVLPHDSTWHRGNLTDESGMTTAPLIDEGQVAYHASLGDNEVFAVDALLPELNPGATTQVRILGTEPTFVEVTLDGRPAPQVYVEVLGARSGRQCDASYTDAQGRSRSNAMTRTSNAAYRVILPGTWWGKDSAELRPGLNKAELRSMGVLRAADEQTLGSVLNGETATRVQEWVEAGLTQITPAESGGVKARVPVGVYLWNVGQDSEWTATVTADSEPYSDR